MTLYEMIEEAKAEGRAEGEAKVLAAAKELGIDITAIVEKLNSATSEEGAK